VGPIKNKPVQLLNGDILYPSSTEELGWRVHFEKSDALIQNWEKTKPLNDGERIGAIQPSLLSFGFGRWQGIGRTQQGRLFSIESLDNGQSWGTLSLLALPNPNAGTDAVTLRDGRQLLIYNHSDHNRSPLNLALSNDGKRWEMALTLESTPGEFSYPAIIQTADGLVHCTYTWNRQFIRHAVIDPTQLRSP
jgi:predicted neuraminidase